MAFNPSGLTKKEIAELRADLETKLASLTKDISDLERDLTLDDSEKAAPDEMDRSSYEEEMQRLQNILDGKSKLRFEVQDAIARIDENAYGVCEESEEPIGFKRLKAQPWTRFSLESQKDIESKSQFRMGGSSSYPSAYGNDGKSDSDEQ